MITDENSIVSYIEDEDFVHWVPYVIEDGRKREGGRGKIVTRRLVCSTCYGMCEHIVSIIPRLYNVSDFISEDSED